MRRCILGVDHRIAQLVIRDACGLTPSSFLRETVAYATHRAVPS